MPELIIPLWGKSLGSAIALHILQFRMNLNLFFSEQRKEKTRVTLVVFRGTGGLHPILTINTAPRWGPSAEVSLQGCRAGRESHVWSEPASQPPRATVAFPEMRRVNPEALRTSGSCW